MDNKKITFNKYSNVLNITLASVFAGLCFAVMFLPKISIPAAVGNPYIHFGNLIVILVALLFGGIIGGISGSIGMGLYDIITGYGIWTIKTVILKFGIGAIAGYIFFKYRKKEKVNINLKNLIIGSIFIFFGISIMIIAICNGSVIKINNKSIALSWPLYVFSIIAGIVFLLMSLISRKKSKDYSIAMYASSLAVIFNIVGELIGKFVKASLEGNGIKVSFVMAISSIPATIINGVISLVIVMLIYPILSDAIKKVSLISKEGK